MVAKLKNSNCEKTCKLKLRNNHKLKNLTKKIKGLNCEKNINLKKNLKNSNCDNTLKLKLGLTQKLKFRQNSNSDKTQKL